MRAQYKSVSGRLLVEVEGPNVKALFEGIAEVQEILDADATCGNCGSPLVKFRVRRIGTDKYYELHCEACTADLSFGQLRDGTGLFPKRIGENKLPLPNRGWHIYRRDEHPPASAQPPAPRRPR